MKAIIPLIIMMIFAPLMSALILKVKAFFAGKQGPPLFICYYTIAKLLKKGSVYSQTTTFIFQLFPVVSLSASMSALMFFPIAGLKPLFSFEGDVIFVLYIFGLARFFTILAALDTGSPFEGMGAAREAYFAIISEISLFMNVVLLYTLTKSLSFSVYFWGNNPVNLWQKAEISLVFSVVSLMIILLVENTRVPVDDPATHLELTMIHEVMILDHSGPDLAMIELGSCFKLMFFSGILARLLCPFDFGTASLNVLSFSVMLVLIYCLIGVIESTIARYRMKIVPKFVLTSFALAFFAMIFVWR